MFSDRKNRAKADAFTRFYYCYFFSTAFRISSQEMCIRDSDGALAYRLTHPKHQITKTYQALVAGTLSKERLAKLRKGVDIGGFVTSPAQVRVIRQAERSALVEIKIHEGKNRQVRKMFAAVGNPVQELCRTAVGDLYLGRLKEDHYRKLTRKEIEYLKKL